MVKLMMAVLTLALSACGGGRYGSHSAFPNNSQFSQGLPYYNQYGQPYRYVPQDGQGGAAMGPVRPNAYGPGVGSDATGRPVVASPW